MCIQMGDHAAGILLGRERISADEVYYDVGSATSKRHIADQRWAKKSMTAQADE
jgi:hypothetical protein